MIFSLAAFHLDLSSGGNIDLISTYNKNRGKALVDLYYYFVKIIFCQKMQILQRFQPKKLIFQPVTFTSLAGIK